MFLSSKKNTLLPLDGTDGTDGMVVGSGKNALRMGMGWGGGVGGSWGRGKTHLGWGWGQVYSPNASMSLVHSHPPSQNIWTKFARHENRGTVPRDFGGVG